ncbi:hypothetical protein Golob_011611, partial [Gossypium lobatum]|nr:hypothetical protein [Gossypium lobatum]
NKHLFRALVQFWNSAYSCFTFEKVDLVSTIEEYIALLLLGYMTRQFQICLIDWTGGSRLSR